MFGDLQHKLAWKRKARHAAVMLFRKRKGKKCLREGAMGKQQAMLSSTHWVLLRLNCFSKIVYYIHVKI